MQVDFITQSEFIHSAHLKPQLILFNIKQQAVGCMEVKQTLKETQVPACVKN